MKLILVIAVLFLNLNAGSHERRFYCQIKYFYDVIKDKKFSRYGIHEIDNIIYILNIKSDYINFKIRGKNYSYYRKGKFSTNIYDKKYNKEKINVNWFGTADIDLYFYNDYKKLIKHSFNSIDFYECREF